MVMGKAKPSIENFTINPEVVRARLGFNKESRDRFEKQRQSVLKERQMEWSPKERREQVG